MSDEGDGCGQGQSANFCRSTAMAVVKHRVPISVVPRRWLWSRTECQFLSFHDTEHHFRTLWISLVHFLSLRIQILIDSRTRYPFAYPLRSATAKAVCQCLIDVFAEVEVPSKITYDQGTCFTAEIITKFLEMLGVVSHGQPHFIVKAINWRKGSPGHLRRYWLICANYNISSGTK